MEVTYFYIFCCLGASQTKNRSQEDLLLFGAADFKAQSS